MLSVLYGAGVRRAEAVALDVTDYDAATGALAIRRGKSRQQRMVYATNGSRAALDAWLAVRDDVPGALFLPVTRRGRLRPPRAGSRRTQCSRGWRDSTRAPASGRARRTIYAGPSSQSARPSRCGRLVSA